MKNLYALVVIATILVVATPATLPASDGSDRVEVLQPKWGVNDNIVHTIAAAGFTNMASNSVWYFNSKHYLYVTSGNIGFLSPLTLPAGAMVVALELEACDESDIKSGIAVIRTCPHRGEFDCAFSATAGTGTTETPGCGGFFIAIDPPLVIDNLSNTYVVQVLMGYGSEVRFLSVLVSYQLQVSPAPVTATFSDVPTDHLFFRHIEALSDSGITAGCGGGNFCPNAPVTRGQMAVFLAKALGLHWPY